MQVDLYSHCAFMELQLIVIFVLVFVYFLLFLFCLRVFFSSPRSLNSFEMRF